VWGELTNVRVTGDQQCVGVTQRDKGGTDTLVAGTRALDRTGRSRRDTGN